jgi:hypothetical protein
MITVNDIFQKNYKYKLIEPVGKNFDKEFKPDFTPKEMLELGIWGGMYFHDGGEKEFPKAWFKKAKISEDGSHQKNLNFFQVKASKPLQYWRDKGWIYKDDPRGWIQWYFRYYLGRRIPKEDQRQIKRWKAISRHIAQLRKNCRKGDFHCRPVQRQAILHWAYDSREM